MEVLYQALEWIMNGCYAICNNYGIAIILFTLISKIILLPVSIWVQKNRPRSTSVKNIIQWHL